jgi:mono/diheme cytochrome c family protein
MRYALLLIVTAVAVGSAFASRAMTDERGGFGNVTTRSAAKNCASCHGREGRGKTFKGKLKHARDLANSEWQGNVSDERLFNSIMNGKGKMPAYEKKLAEPEIDALVAFVRGLKK